MSPDAATLLLPCESCHRPTRLTGLTGIVAQSKQSDLPHVTLICGPCFVDGPEVAA